MQKNKNIGFPKNLSNEWQKVFEWIEDRILAALVLTYIEHLKK